LSIDFEEIHQGLINMGFSDEEIERKVQEKSSEFKGFITKEAILFLLAKEYGLDVISSDVPYMDNKNGNPIDYNDFLVNIEQISEGMINLVIAGQIKKIFYSREFIRKDGSSGRVGAFIIKDSTGEIKITLWDDQCEIFNNDFFQTGEIVQVIGAYSKLGLNEDLELHLSRQGKIILTPKAI
jgi:hypothetical protein